MKIVIEELNVLQQLTLIVQHNWKGMSGASLTAVILYHCRKADCKILLINSKVAEPKLIYNSEK